MLKPFAKLMPEQLSFTVGDPHFYGFEGESFDFMGEPNRHYNLLTDTDVQVNAYFVYWATCGSDNFTATEQIGILVNDHRIRISPAGLTVDGRVVPDTRQSYRIANGRVAAIERFERVDGRIPEIMRGHLGFGDFIRGYHVKTRCGYEFVVTVSTDHVNPPYLNLLSRMSRRLWPHGIIGQTADHDGVARQGRGHDGEGIIEGCYRDYEVGSLWGTDCKFNKYRTADRRPKAGWLFFESPFRTWALPTYSR